VLPFAFFALLTAAIFAALIHIGILSISAASGAVGDDFGIPRPLTAGAIGGRREGGQACDIGL
jgi:hypothetical protein